MKTFLSKNSAIAIMGILLLVLVLFTLQLSSSSVTLAQGGSTLDGGEAGYTEQPEGSTSSNKESSSVAHDELEDPWLVEETLAISHEEASDPIQNAVSPTQTLNTGHIGYYDEQTGEWVDDDTVTTYSANDDLVETAVEQQAYQDKLKEIDPAQLTFRSGVTIRPEPGIAPSVLTQLTTSPQGSASSDNYYLIQFSYPFPIEARHRLEAVGVTLHDHVNTVSFYASIPSEAVAALTELAVEGLVRYVGEIPLEAKVEPALIAEAVAAPSASYQVTVLTFVAPIPAQLQELASLMTIDHRSDGAIYITEGTAPASSIQPLAQLGYVRWIEQQPINELQNLEGGMGIGGDVVRQTGLDGTDVNVMIVDTGIARSGSTYHPDLLGGRILDQWDYQNSDSVAADDHSHGTHVAGTVGGRYNSGDGNSNRSWQGMTPDVDFYIYKLCCGTGQFSSSWFQAAMQRGSSSGRTTHISQNSWGSSIGDTYNTNSEIADSAVHGDYNNNHMNVVMSSGNDNHETAAPGTGKNVITVGLVKDGNYPDQTLNYTACSDKVWPPGKRFCFSNHGPIDTDGDGNTRVKPDVMAPGIMTTSARPWYMSGASYYGDKAGTSMAAPHVSGTIAQILDSYSGSAPWLWSWPETVKSLLLATTVDVGGNTDLYGRGLVNPYHAIYNQSGVSSVSFWGSNIASGATKDFTFSVPSGYQELRVVLTWSDPPGSAEVSHDLDIQSVTDPGGVSRGASTSLDDTVEYVTLPAGYTTGTWTVRVKAHSTASDQRFGLTVHRVLADADLDVAPVVQYISASGFSVDPNDHFYLHQYLSNSGFTAGGSYTRLYVPDDFTVIGVRLYTADGHSHWYDDSQLYHPLNSPYWRLSAGEVIPGYTRHARWYIQANSDIDAGAYMFYTVPYWQEGGNLQTGAQKTTIIFSNPENVFLPFITRN